MGVGVDAIGLNTAEIRDISAEVMDDGRMRVLPAAFWAGTTMPERALFGHRHGLYLFPTTELVERLTQIIAGRSAVEIGAGSGVLADALGIVGTDNKQQEMPKYRAIYDGINQPVVQYGPNIVQMHASRAVRRYKPQVVIGAWITHKYDPAQHERGGNEIGVDQRDVLLNCEAYVLVGNDKAHRFNPLWSRPHEIEYPPYVFSRAHGGRDFVAVFRGAKAQTAMTRP